MCLVLFFYLKFPRARVLSCFMFFFVLVGILGSFLWFSCVDVLVLCFSIVLIVGDSGAVCLFDVILLVCRVGDVLRVF